MAEYIEKEVALSMHEPPKSNRHYQTDNLDDAYGQGWDDALCSIEQIPAADVAPIEALERLRDELCAQDLITMEGLRKLNTLIWKHTTVHDGGADHG